MALLEEVWRRRLDRRPPAWCDADAARVASMNWTIQKTVPTLAVPALDAAAEFYGRIGFQEGWRWPSEAPLCAGLERGACELMLTCRGPALTVELYFVVDDVDACHAEVLAGGAWHLAQPPLAPVEADHGYREFALVDPWGHRLTFGERTRGAQS